MFNAFSQVSSYLWHPYRRGESARKPEPSHDIPQPYTPEPLHAPNRFYLPSAEDTFQYTIPKAHGEVETDKTKVQSLLGGGQIFGKIDELLKKAEAQPQEGTPKKQKPWILVDMYNLQSPELYPERQSLPNTPGADIHAGLVDRLINLHKQKKANVRIILDHSKQQPRELEKGQPPELMEENHNDRTIAKLKANGVKVVTYPPDVSLKNHTKILLMDNRHAIIGGMNWGNHSAMNHDGAVSIEGPDARNIFHKVVKPDWLTAEGKVSELPPIKPFRQGQIKVLQTSGRNSEQGAKDEVLREILHQVKKSEKSIHAQHFVLTHKKVTKELIRKHQELIRNGKEGVKILVDEGLYKKFPNCRTQIQKLDEAGVPIRFFKENKDTEEKLHAKWTVFDREKLLIGSANYSAIGLDSKDATAEGELSDEAESSEAEEGEEYKVPSKTNHEVAVLIENAKNVAGTFARQADHDFRDFHLTKPVSWAKRVQNKPWSEQPVFTRPKQTTLAERPLAKRQKMNQFA